MRQVLPQSFHRAASEMRRSRQRRRDKMLCLRVVELRRGEVDALVRMRLLDADARNSPAAVCEGLYLFLERQLDPGR